MRKVLSVILILALTFSICACGSPKQEEPQEYVYKDTFLSEDNPGNPTVMGLFYRNVASANIISDDPAVLEVDKKADEMLEKIENYPDSEIKATGTVYYISNEGDDTNDGLSPETPLKTYATLRLLLKSGDVVLFRRGDIFRGQIKMVSGVTYAAYGEGIKPRLYGSRDGKEYEWVETEEEDIYAYTGIIGNYSNIIFNNGEFIGRPVFSDTHLKRRPLSVKVDSKLKIYSPDGNPGEIFDNIEIVDGYSLFTGSGGGLRDVKVENLCLMYTGVHFFGTLGPVYNMEISGCIMGYCGGRDLASKANAISLGNAVEFWSVAEDVNVHDNYIFQAYDAALTHQGPTTVVDGDEQVGATNYTNIHYEKNLIEYCTYDFEAFSCRSVEKQKLSPNGTFTYNDVYIRDNICRYNGYGWGSLDRPDKNVCTNFKYDASGEKDEKGNYTNLHIKPLTIENNIFDRSRRSVFGISSPSSNKKNMIIKNNLLLQRGRSSIVYGATLEGDYISAMNERFTASDNVFEIIKY